MSLTSVAGFWGIGILLAAVTIPLLFEYDFSVAEIIAFVVLWPLGVVALLLIGAIRLASRAWRAV